jgi:transketolase
MSHAAGAAHLGSALSCVDILVAAYWDALKIDPQQPDDPDRDRFLLSKGHASAALYATLAARGFFPPEQLATYGQNGSHLAEQMSPACAPGVEAATGSLGHGLSLGLGMALAARIQHRSYRVWVLMSDGECNEGSVWEAAMFASAQALDNVTVMIDYNGWQATGRSDEIMALRPLKDKWESFGFAVRQVDGHDLKILPAALSESTQTRGRPSCIIADTVKGKGVSFMEDNNNWHYRVPNDEELRAALVELGQQ